MAKKTKKEPKIKLAHPDRSAPTDKTLLDFAQDRNLFAQADQVEARIRRKGKDTLGLKATGKGDSGDADSDEEGLDPAVDHVMDSFFYGVSLAILHVTLDVLVQHQYAMRINWRGIFKRGVLGLLRMGSFHSFLMTMRIHVTLLDSLLTDMHIVFTFLVFVLHNHPGNEFLFGIPKRFQSKVRETLFFAASVGCGCYLIYVTNKEGYLRVMKKTPSLGCLWVWSVVEMRLGIAIMSLMINALYMWWAGLSLV